MKVQRTKRANPVRIGIVGCGNVMDGAYMPVLQKLQQQNRVQVVGASHTSRARCRQVLKKWAIPRYFDSFQALCRAPDIDVVVILTPMISHAAIAREALQAGKHVLVEKPLAGSLREASQLLALAKRARRHLVCAPFVTLSPTFNIIRERIVRGDVGKICLARGRYGWSGPDWSEWFYRRGGGPIFDLAVYSITSLTGILGPVKRVAAMTGTAQSQRKIKGRLIKVVAEDNAQIILDFGRAVFASITSGFTMQKYRSPALELYGTDGTIQLMGDDWAPEGYELWQNGVDAWQTYGETDPHWNWTQGMVHLIDCIERRERPLVLPTHAYHVLEVMLAAQKAGRTGRAQRVTSRFALPQRRDTADPGASHVEAAHRVHDRRRA